MENRIWLAIVSLIAIVMTITEFFKRLFKVDKRWFNELISLIVCEGAAFIAWILGSLPTWFNPEWACTLVNGFFLFLATSKLFYEKLDLVKEIFDVVFNLFGPKLGGKWYSKKAIEEKEE